MGIQLKNFTSVNEGVTNTLKQILLNYTILKSSCVKDRCNALLARS